VGRILIIGAMLVAEPEGDPGAVRALLAGQGSEAFWHGMANTGSGAGRQGLRAMVGPCSQGAKRVGPEIDSTKIQRKAAASATERGPAAVCILQVEKPGNPC